MRLKLAILLCLLVGLWPGRAVAQSSDQALHLITSPLPVSLATKPGTSVSSPLRVQNAGSQTETLKVGLLKFSAYGDTGVPKIEERQPGDDFFDWVTFSEDTFSLAPNQWKSITMTIAVPETAAFGYYYAVTFSRAEEQVDGGQPQTALVGSTATLVLLEAQAPGAVRSVEVVDFTPNQPRYEFLPATFIVRLKNTGNVHVAPRGNIFIQSRWGKKEVGTIEVNPTKGNILPGTTRVFEVAWTDGFPVYQPKTQDGRVVTDEQGQPEMELHWDFSQANKLRMGNYDASLVLAYDDGTKDVPIEAATSFWVIPWRILLVVVVNIIIVVGFFVLLTYVIRQQRKKR